MRPAIDARDQVSPWRELPAQEIKLRGNQSIGFLKRRRELRPNSRQTAGHCCGVA
jgi:hypothetical protein